MEMGCPMLDKLSQKPHIDMYRHFAFACVGGYFASYAILTRFGVMANAQTMNLVELVLTALTGSWAAAVQHLGSFVIYVAGTMLTVLLPRRLGWSVRRLSPFVSAAAAVAMAFIPMDTPVIVSLYPIFFAVSFQWSSYHGADGFYSSTIFSTNNTKQASLSLAEYLCDGDKAHLRKTRLYALTLLHFHLGAALGLPAAKALGAYASLCLLPLLAWCYILVVAEDNAPAADKN